MHFFNSLMLSCGVWENKNNRGFKECVCRLTVVEYYTSQWQQRKKLLQYGLSKTARIKLKGTWGS